MLLSAKDAGAHRDQSDVIIVGSGLAGSWAAKELTQAGLNVLLLEAGPVPEPGQLTEGASWTPEQRQRLAARQPIQSGNAAYWASPRLFVDDLDNPYAMPPDAPFVWIRGRQVGGRSHTWGGVTLRFSDHEFLAPNQDGIGPQWPITHRDLDSHYAKVEAFFEVSGARDQIPEVPDGNVQAPVAFSAHERAFRNAVQQHWADRRFMIVRGIDPNRARKIGDDENWPARSSMNRILPTALDTGRLSLRHGVAVSRLIMDSTGHKVRGVACVDCQSRETFQATARAVVLAASTIESVRILLNSRSASHPEGVGNSSGLLGKGLMDHMAATLSGLLPPIGSAIHSMASGGLHSFCIPRFRNLTLREGLPFRRGYGIYGSLGRTFFREGPDKQPLPIGTFVALMEVLSDDANSIAIDDKLRDAWGIPAVRIRFRYSENERLMLADACKNLLAAGAMASLEIKQRSVTLPGQFVHELGGARMGSDPRQSVLNRFNQCWDSRNLLVVDGACFPSSGWQNPTLTIMAIAGRAAAHLVSQLQQGEL